MKPSRRFGILCLVLAIVFWSFTGIFVKHLSFQGLHGDVQNLFRYLSATLGLWVLVLSLFGREAIAALRRWRTFLAPALINCVFQVAMVSALYKKSIYPGFNALLNKSSVIFAVVLAFILFRDERRTIVSWRYLAGCAVAIAGMVGVVMFGERAQADFKEGVFLVILAAFLWACYTVAMKGVVTVTRPLISFAIVASYTTLFFIVLASLRSRPSQFLEISTRDQVIVVVSGLLCISAAHSLYFRAVERLGVAVCASFLLVQPLSTGILSATLLDETFRLPQLFMGALLLGGTYLVVLAGPRRVRELSAGPGPTDTPKQ